MRISSQAAKEYEIYRKLTGCKSLFECFKHLIYCNFVLINKITIFFFGK